ncbi:MAG: hypothetical protein M3340_06650 [Actinomycetota bacterium]|nr:hypothetical protein [Actinomycetota bacterium]
MQFKRGSDCPLVRSIDICNWVRHELVHHVDFVVALLYRSSSGCGREVGWATELGIPAVVLAPPGFDTSPLVGGAAVTEGAVTHITIDPYSLPTNKLREWWRTNIERIENSNLRRQRRVRETEGTRIACAKAWNRTSSAHRDAIAEAMNRERGVLRNLLADPVDFAWASADLQGELAERLGVVPLLELSRDALEAQLPDEVLHAFHQAIDEYRWDPHTSSQVLLAGIDHEQVRRREEAAGVSLRRVALTNRAAWKGVYDSLGLNARAS